MADSQLEFGAAEHKHFSSLVSLCLVAAVALLVYAVASASFLVNVIASGNVSLMLRSLDDAVQVLVALFAAYRLNQAARGFVRLSMRRAITWLC